MSYIKDIFFGEDQPFDDDYKALYKRDCEFIKYLFALKESIPNFAGLFPEVYGYLVETFNEITDQNLKTELRNITSSTFDSLETISVENTQQNDLVEILGHNLYQKPTQLKNFTSDFTLKSTLLPDSQILVLPVEAGNRYSELRYTTGKWGKLNAAPYKDSKQNLNSRILPFEGTNHAYLTISDFLEDSIIRVNHVLNKENYFNGNITDNNNSSYLLPLKPRLFEYFTEKEIRDNMTDGKPMLEMCGLAGDSGIKVTIRIPIKGNDKISYIEYSRLYYSNRAADIEHNDGAIVNLNFTGFIMPQIKFNNKADAIYNISCIHNPTSQIAFTFYNGHNIIVPKSCCCRNENQVFLKSADNYLIEHENFDYIQVNNRRGVSGVIIPIFKKQLNIEQFEFAIDLGTSNTHIEYRKAEENPVPFTYSIQDRQLCEMFIPKKSNIGKIESLIEETLLFEKDFIPREIGSNDFKFPTRTVLSCAKTVDWTQIVDPYLLVNIPFTYDKRTTLPYNNNKYNIKWGSGEELRVMELFVQSIMLIIRNKVLLNNGNLLTTKITWFYPISMSPARRQLLNKTWNDAYNKYFGGNGIHSMSESAAPIQYFFTRNANVADLVNVDIGGGTSDIAFASNGIVNKITSFRFASNALFEDSFSKLNKSNGIVDFYKDSLIKLLEDKSINELVRVSEEPNNSYPANMASFLFGLKENSLLNTINSDSIDFNNILQKDEDFKIVFIIFYSSIIYHLAQVVKSFNLNTPRHISFSGNGSKIINVITPDSDILSRYTKLIFEKVIGTPYGKDLDIIGLESDSNPKSATCKGGIIAGEATQFGEIIVLNGDGSGPRKDVDTYDNISTEYKERVINEVKNFFKFILVDMDKEFNFDYNFGVNSKSISIAKESANKDLLTYLEKGITNLLEEAQPNDKLDETLFFYPIKGALQSISAEIFNSLIKNKKS